MRSVYERIKELRTQLHLSQEYVANYLGLSRSTYTQMENGKRKVLADEVAKLSALFGVSTDSLLNDTKGMTREEAIEWLGRIKDRYIHGVDEGFDNKRKEAIDMAIEALQAEPTTRCIECKYFRLCNEDTHLIACGYEWCSWWQRPVISTGYCHCGAKMKGGETE